MLNNLEELEENLKSLVKELSQIHNKIVNPIEAKKCNAQHSSLIKIPKLILLIRVFPYLRMEEIVVLSTSCSAMRKTIYGPIGWKIINQTHTIYPILIKEMEYQPEITLKQRHMSEQEQMMMENQDQKKLVKERATYKDILVKLYEKHQQKLEEFHQTNHKLKSEKMQVFKLKQQTNYYNQLREQVMAENMSYKQKLKHISEGFHQKLKSLDDGYDQLLKEKMKLQNQKEALVGKVKEYQHQIDTIKVESERSKQILKKIKNYLLYKEL